ncbi:hypothetical protein E4U13_002525 [Claviceps humidiphila]|uniref:Uncharacterized protein n=1 Tax=Claviceps humidiphila TaxID=1294629 RepID=A0A9P7TU80_9HYPO|nr:hypothetical protein E4U13_002525 [Claviceps humidiphila]
MSPAWAVSGIDALVCRAESRDTTLALSPRSLSIDQYLTQNLRTPPSRHVLIQSMDHSSKLFDPRFVSYASSRVDYKRGPPEAALIPEY